MRILVSKDGNKKTDFPDYMVVTGAEDALRLRGNLDMVVLDAVDVPGGRPTKYPELVKKAKLTVYISPEAEMDAHLKLLVEGAGGLYLDNSLYLKNQTVLEGYLERYQGVDIAHPQPVGSKELVSTGVESVLDSFESVDKDEPLSPQSRDLLLRTLKDYTKEVKKLTEDQERMAKSALDYAEQNTKLYDQISKTNAEMSSQLDHLEEMVSDQSSRGYRAGGLSIFPKYKLNASKLRSHIKIKKIGSAVFCMSFTLGLKAWMTRVKNVRSQVIVLAPDNEYFRRLYSMYPWITQDSYRDGSAYTSDVVFVGYPTKQVMEKLSNNDGYFESLIFLDMLTQDVRHMVLSNKKSWYFSSSLTMVKRLNLPLQDTIFSMKKPAGSAFGFKSWKDFPQKAGDRERLYIKNLNTIYSSMYAKSLS